MGLDARNLVARQIALLDQDTGRCTRHVITDPYAQLVPVIDQRDQYVRIAIGVPSEALAVRAARCGRRQQPLALRVREPIDTLAPLTISCGVMALVRNPQCDRSAPRGQRVPLGERLGGCDRTLSGGVDVGPPELSGVLGRNGAQGLVGCNDPMLNTGPRESYGQLQHEVIAVRNGTGGPHVPTDRLGEYVRLARAGWGHDANDFIASGPLLLDSGQ